MDIVASEDIASKDGKPFYTGFFSDGCQSRFSFLRHSRCVAAILSLIALSAPNLVSQVGTKEGSLNADGVALVRGAVNPRARRENDRGPINGDRRLARITLTFKRTPEQRSALDHLLEEQQNPASPNYHKWLTPEEFGNRFGIDQGHLDEILGWLWSNAFTVESTARSRSWVVFSGTVRQVESAFHTEIHRYDVDEKIHFAPAVPPGVPAEFASLVGTIRGLDDFYLEPPRHFRPMYTAADGTHLLAPGDAAAIYHFDYLQTTGTRGHGQNIVVVGQSAVELADIRKFRSTFLLSDNMPTTILVGDDPGYDPTGGMLEADIDIEWAGVAAPDAQITYVYAIDVLDAAQAAIDRNLAPILSFSYGSCEASVSADGAAALRDLAQQANAQGITWIASSGDAGAAACDQGSYPASHGLAVSLPASLPEVTGVGGTQFDEGGNDIDYWEPNDGLGFPDHHTAVVYIPEIAWNSTSVKNGLQASGGGASTLFPKPAWQNGPGVPANDARNVPDLSFSASVQHDPYLIISGGSTYAGGGTSVSAPLFAGILALVNEAVVKSSGGSPGLGNVNPSLYEMAQPPAFGASPFHDITSGNNIVPCVSGTPDCRDGSIGFTAGNGYDQVTGLGSLNVFAFVSEFRVATTTTLSLSADQATEGGQLELDAVVRPGDPSSAVNRGPVTGGVIFLMDSIWYVGLQVAVDSSGRATTTITVPAGGWGPGPHSITARYGGDVRYGGSTSQPVPITVLPTPPPKPSLLGPADQATGVPIPTTLVFTSFEATSFDVYFGTTSPPPFWGTTSGPCTPITEPNTKYYWSVIARNVSGSAASGISSFTTTIQRPCTITTLAGNGQYGFSGDSGPAIQAQLSLPSDMAVDSAGNIYIADSGNNRVRMVTPAGIISTVAGSGAAVNSGDGGPAIAAGLSSVSGLAVDFQGNLYISAGNRFEKFLRTGSYPPWPAMTRMVTPATAARRPMLN
jgi:hypothetical protein